MEELLGFFIEVFGEFFFAALLELMPSWIRKATLAALAAVVVLAMWWGLRS